MDFGSRVKLAREQNGLTQDELARRVGYSGKWSIAKIETGVSDVPRTKIARLAEALGVSVGYLMGFEDLPPKKERPAYKRIPVLGRVPAGIPVEAIEDILDFEDISAEYYDLNREYFGLQVYGDSMYPKYVEGDIIICEVLPDCDSGQDCVVMINGYDATLKQVIKYTNGMIELRPFNRNYTPVRYSAEEIESLPVTICGVVRELRRRL